MERRSFLALMEKMPKAWRYHFCGGNPSQRTGVGGCACLGCANNSGGLGNSQAAYDLWLAWTTEHPDVPDAYGDILAARFNPNRLPR